jgi:hypothetical protein
MTDIQIVLVEQRRICWPEFDATCLEGGCGYCNDNPYRSMRSIERKAKKMGTTYNRGNGKKRDPMEAFQYGRDHHWNNADSRVVENKHHG